MSEKIDFGAAAENTTAVNPLIGLAREDLIGAVGVMLRETAGRPVTTVKHLGRFAGEVAKIVQGKSELAPSPKDKRFQDPTWQRNPLYRAGLQYWLAVQQGLDSWVRDVKLDELERARAKFVLGMIVDALAPTNALIGNPAAIKKAYETGGASLFNGLKNVYHDVTKNNFMVSQVDKRPFRVGENLATAKGAVVHRTEMMELIQYAMPTGVDEVSSTPLLIIPPQINKFYVNDLTPEKSLIQFLAAHGLQPFIISWRNPGFEHRDWGLDAYVEGIMDAIGVVAQITKSKKVNVCGACSGGITTATLLSRMAAEKDERINAFVLMVCVLDPQREDSEVGALVSKNGIEMARRRSAREGILKGQSLARMFAWLRPNDLVWNYVINNYFLGESPPPFDVLFWNNDATNLPAALHSDYLRMYEDQPFANPGAVELAGHIVDLTKVKQDCFVVAGVTDHITPWKACFRTTQLVGSPNVEFILSHSGHIQALLNPPFNPKAKYYRNTHAAKPPASVDAWMMGASEVQGSWWGLWKDWLVARSGEKQPAPKRLGSKKHPELEPSPGSYVFEQAA